MCGIVGYIGRRDALAITLDGLQKLEYRGYDSAGVAVATAQGVQIARASGKLAALRERLRTRPLAVDAHLAIGHTRWATHGRPSDENAHPHRAGRVSLIHNGIIENYADLKAELTREGREFASETDSEIAAHLLDRALRRGATPRDALREVCSQIRGSYAILAIDEENPDRILVAKTATPIVIGEGDGERIVASDIPAVLSSTREVVILEDGDLGEITANGIDLENDGRPVARPAQTITWNAETAQKGGYDHYMLKEIYEQPRAVADALRGRIDESAGTVSLPEIGLSEERIREIDRVVIVACGTAWHAGLVGKFLFETYAGLPCEVDYASEFRYRDVPLTPNTLVLAISQSGETADTLGAVDRAVGTCPTLAICNAVGSTLARKVAGTLMTHAGPEISVASTKAFTTQLITTFLLAEYFGQVRGHGDPAARKLRLRDLTNLPAALDDTLSTDDVMKNVADALADAEDFLFLGRGPCFPIALEGALKLKEISYLHAEGYSAGEIKHGPLALVDERMPVVMLLNRSVTLEKTLSNLQEVRARGGRMIVITDAELPASLHGEIDALIETPFVSEAVSPIVMTLPLQFLAYHVARRRGADIDLPRNLAKSVTVE